MQPLLLTFIALALMAPKPISDMNQDELQQRMRELMAEIAANGMPTAEQDAELNAIIERSTALSDAAIADMQPEAEAAEREAARREALEIPGTMPLDAIGRGIARGLPKSFRGEECNRPEDPDIYQNYTSWYADKDPRLKATGQYFYRVCGDDSGAGTYYYRYSVDSRNKADGALENLEERYDSLDEPGITKFTVCGQIGYSSEGFQSTFLILDERAVLNVDEWEGSNRAASERLAVQREMLEAVDCAAILAVLPQ